MSKLEKLVILGSLARAAYNKWQYPRFLSIAVIITGLTIITSIMVSTFLIAGFYAAYLLLLHYEMQPQNAILITGALFALTTAFFLFLTARCVQDLRKIPQRVLQLLPSTNHFNEAIDAFMEGVMAENSR